MFWKSLCKKIRRTKNKLMQKLRSVERFFIRNAR